MVDRHAGVPIQVRQITQLALLTRLAALVLTMASTVGQEFTLGRAGAMMILGATSFIGLMWTSRLQVVRRNPSLALVDTIIIALAVFLDGTSGLVSLAALSTALLVGMWTDVKAGLIVVPVLVLLYEAGAAHQVASAEEVLIRMVVLPFVYVTLWALGTSVQRSVDQELRAQLGRQEAVAAAAAMEERTRVAQELHDSLSKTLQGMNLTATAISTLVTRDPEAALESAQQLRQMSASAIREVREVMGNLRIDNGNSEISSRVGEVVAMWELRTGRHAGLELAELGIVDDRVSHEISHCLQEALDNIHRHAGPCMVNVALSFDRATDEVVLQVSDTGRGVSESELLNSAAVGHHGVTGMQERMARLGGSATIESRRGSGTTVEFRAGVLNLVES